MARRRVLLQQKRHRGEVAALPGAVLRLRGFHVRRRPCPRRRLRPLDHARDLLRLARQELRRQPPEDVVHDGLRHRNLGVLRESRRLEAAVGELVDEDLKRHAVLQRHGHRLSEGVHQTRNGRPLLGHQQEDLAGLAVLVQADGEEPLVAVDRELVGDGLPLVRQPAARDAGRGPRRDFRLQVVAGVLRGRQRL